MQERAIGGRKVQREDLTAISGCVRACLLFVKGLQVGNGKRRQVHRPLSGWVIMGTDSQAPYHRLRLHLGHSSL